MALDIYTSKYKKRERTQNWAYEEKKFLLELCRKDMHIIENKRLDSALTSLKNRAWKLIHQQFAQTFGTERNCNRLKEQWRRMKACTRAEVLDYQHRVSKFGQEVADKKKPSQFTFEIWEFMQEAKRVCKNELMDEMDYSKMKLSLEENIPEGDLPSEEMNDSDDSNNSSSWGRTSQNVCEVQLNDDTQADHPSKRRRTVSSVNASSIPDVPHFYQHALNNDGHNSAPAFDLLSFFKSQYFATMENLARSQTTNGPVDIGNPGETGVSGASSTMPYLNGTRVMDELKQKEQSMRLEILQVELETAKLNRDIAEINKQIAIKRLSREGEL